MLTPPPLRTSLARALLIFAWSEPALAQPGVHAARLEVRSSPGCASRADLIERVLARAPRARFGDEAGALQISATFQALRADQVVSDVVLGASSGTPGSRRVVARSCAEASDAVALIIAVTLDPASTPAPEKPAAEPAREASSSSSQADLRREEARSSRAADTPAGAGAVAVPGQPRWGLTLAAQGLIGPAPAPLLGVSLFALAGIDRPTSWSPALLLGLTRSYRTGVEERGGTASFELDAASLDVCPFRFALSSWEMRTCASALGGRLTSEGTDTSASPGEVVRPFWVLGGSALVSARLVWKIEASARVALGANLVRDSFTFAPFVFHEVGPLTTAASLGVGMGFP